MRLVLALGLLLPLAACLPGGRGGGAGEAVPVAAGQITTTALDVPVMPGDAEVTGGAMAEAEAVPQGGGSALPDPVATPVATAAPKSEAELACDAAGGTWAKAGEGGGMSCIFTTRDGGTRCDSKTDCEGECLARSGTCAPIRPLFGCNEVLMDNGAEVTLCLE